RNTALLVLCAEIARIEEPIAVTSSTGPALRLAGWRQLKRSEAHLAEMQCLVGKEVQQPRNAGVGARRRHRHPLTVGVEEAAASDQRDAHPVAPPARCCAAESSAFVARENDTFASSGEAEVKSWVMSLTPFAAECAESHPVVAWSRRRIAPVPARRVVLADE